MWNTRRNEIGFTLIELLVLIAVIAVLAAILFPVFAQVREKARQVACLSNLRQIGAATMLYLQDYDETFPGGPRNSRIAVLVWGYWVPGPDGTWENMPTQSVNVAPVSVALRLQPYLKTDRIFHCPNNPTGVPAYGYWDTRFTNQSYFWQSGLSQSWSWLAMPKGDAFQTGPPLTLAQIPKPVLLPMIGDVSPEHHSRLLPGEARWNMAYADGHAKFTRWVDGWIPDKEQPGPFGWDYFNPQRPVDVEKPCSPSCLEESARP